MINIMEVTETNKMVEKENLDVRTITMGINLLDCAGPDLAEVNEKIYNKITTLAKDLVSTQLAGKAIGCLKFTAIIIHKYNSLFRLFRVGHITAAGSLAVLCSVAISWVACGMVRLWAADAAGRMSACLST